MPLTRGCQRDGEGLRGCSSGLGPRGGDRRGRGSTQHRTQVHPSVRGPVAGVAQTCVCVMPKHTGTFFCMAAGYEKHATEETYRRREEENIDPNPLKDKEQGRRLGALRDPGPSQRTPPRHGRPSVRRCQEGGAGGEAAKGSARGSEASAREPVAVDGDAPRTRCDRKGGHAGLLEGGFQEEVERACRPSRAEEWIVSWRTAPRSTRRW